MLNRRGSRGGLRTPVERDVSGSEEGTGVPHFLSCVENRTRNPWTSCRVGPVDYPRSVPGWMEIGCVRPKLEFDKVVERTNGL